MAIEDRGSRVASHAGRAHFVDPEPGLRAEPAFSIGVVGAYVLAAGRLRHLGRRGGHVLAHRQLVLAPGAMDAEHGDPELVGLFGQLDVVVGTGQALTEPGHAHGPAARVVPTTTSDRKSTRLNSSHDQISYAVFCLKKKKKYDATPLILPTMIAANPPGTLEAWQAPAV